MGKLFFPLQISPLVCLTLSSSRLAASSPFHKSPICDVIFSRTLNSLSGVVSKICWLNTQHTEDMTTQKFLPFLFGHMLFPDYMSVSCGSHFWVLVLSAPTYPCQLQLCSLPTPVCVTCPVWSPAVSSHEHSQPACLSSTLPGQRSVLHSFQLPWELPLLQTIHHVHEHCHS